MRSSALDATRRPLRITQLDSLRGVAALTVVLCHCKEFYVATGAWGAALLDVFPLGVVFSGHGSVMVFFALSGLVLFSSFASVDRFEYAPYTVKRVMRLYPPFAVAIVFSACLDELLKRFDVPKLYTTFGQLLDWPELPTPGAVAGHLAMTDTTSWLDPPMWSLVHEMRISFVFPLLAIWVKREWRSAVVVSLLVSLVATYVNRAHPSSMPFQPFATLQYVFLFAGGAALALHASAIRLRMRGLPGWMRAMLWLVALVPMASMGKSILGYVAVFSALLVVALCLSDSLAETLLLGRFPRWLGRISYSLYLVHVPVLLALVHLLWGRVPIPALLALAVVASLIVAEGFQRAVEGPSMALGRRLAKRCSGAPDRALERPDAIAQISVS